MVVNTRIFLRQIHPMYDRTSLGYGGSEENAQSFERALVVTMFIQQNSDSLFLTWLSPWGDGLMPQPLQNWHPSTVDVSMVSFYAWGAWGVYWLFQNEAILLFFMLHLPLHILTKLLPFLYSLECLCDYAMQITAMDIWGYATTPERWNNKYLLYILHNLLLRWLCQNIAMGWDIGLIQACNESTTQRTMRNQTNASICNLSAVLRTVAS